MRLGGLQQGDLAKWLQVVADTQDTPQARKELIPAKFVEHLLLLRCIERDPADHHLRVTDKGRLALRMAHPVRG